MTGLSKKKVLVTGSTGFVGSNVISEFTELGYEVVGVSRSKNISSHSLDISGDTDWSNFLQNVDLIVHCAAAVHQMNISEDILNKYHQTNVDGTLNLANQAKDIVKRFIFLSTIKVNGEETIEEKFCADDNLNPGDPYSISKTKAELGLMKIARSSEMEVVIIRPPLVYGPNPKGNLKKLTKFIVKGIPLPLGLVTHNSRSLLYLGNLVDFINVCAEHKAAKNETFLISDDSDLSTAGIISLIGESLGVRVTLLPIPIFIIKFLLRIIGKSDYEARLLGDLCLDVTKSKKLLNWKPKFSVQEGFYNSFRR